MLIVNRMIRDWKNFKKDAFRKELKTKLTLFSSNTQNLDPNAKFNRFMKIADTVVNKYLPLRPCTNKEQRRRENPWMTNAIFKSIKNKDKLYFIKMKYRLAINEQRYKQYRNYLNRIIRKAKKDYYITKLQASANKSKAIWSVINEILSKKRKRTEIKKIKTPNGQHTNDPQQIADAFNNYFCSIGSKLASEIPDVPHKIFSPRVQHSFALFETNPEEISKLIAALNPKKGNRLNDIPTSMIKLSNYIISPFLSEIFNSCMTQGCYPDRLKIAQVIPVYKKGPKDECSNYRPISLLSNMNKLFERILYSRLSVILTNSSYCNQYGFRKDHCTSMAIYDILESKIGDRDKGNITCAVYLDLSKAFDTVDSNLLLKKLEHYGIRGTALGLFRSYLSNRKQCTNINSILSELISIELGVPQGSILGPFLFLVYINDLPNSSLLLSKLFADDTCLLFSANSVANLQNIANQEIAKIEKWMTSNKLTLNHTKSKFMVINKRGGNCNLNVRIKNELIEKVYSIEYLGITIDSNLSWNEHIKQLESSLSTASGIISKLRHYVSFDC